MTRYDKQCFIPGVMVKITADHSQLSNIGIPYVYEIKHGVIQSLLKFPKYHWICLKYPKDKIFSVEGHDQYGVLHRYMYPQSFLEVIK